MYEISKQNQKKKKNQGSAAGKLRLLLLLLLSLRPCLRPHHQGNTHGFLQVLVPVNPTVYPVSHKPRVLMFLHLLLSVAVDVVDC